MHKSARESGSNTYGVSLNNELPLNSRLEFVGNPTAEVGAPFVKALWYFREP